MYYNKCILIGYAVDIPIVKKINNNTKVATFSITYKSIGGQKEQVSIIDCKIFGETESVEN